MRAVGDIKKERSDLIQEESESSGPDLDDELKVHHLTMEKV